LYKSTRSLQARIFTSSYSLKSLLLFLQPSIHSLLSPGDFSNHHFIPLSIQQRYPNPKHITPNQNAFLHCHRHHPFHGRRRHCCAHCQRGYVSSHRSGTMVDLDANGISRSRDPPEPRHVRELERWHDYAD
jgi:hypothetical protein